jgi:hypothetical protein
VPRTTTIIGLGLVAATGAIVAVGWQSAHREVPLAHEALPAPAVVLTTDFASADATCPAYATKVPAPMHDGGGGTATTMLGDDDALLLSCFGTVDQVGHLDELVDDRRAHGVSDAPLVGPPVAVTSPLGESVRTEYRIGSHTITEWVVEKDGAIFAVGYLHDGTARHLAEVHAVMAAWRWT